MDFLYDVPEVVFYSSQFHVQGLGLDDCVSCSWITIPGLTNATRIQNYAFVEAFNMLDVNVAEN